MSNSHKDPETEKKQQEEEPIKIDIANLLITERIKAHLSGLGLFGAGLSTSLLLHNSTALFTSAFLALSAEFLRKRYERQEEKLEEENPNTILNPQIVKSRKFQRQCLMLSTFGLGLLVAAFSCDLENKNKMGLLLVGATALFYARANNMRRFELAIEEKVFQYAQKVVEKAIRERDERKPKSRDNVQKENTDISKNSPREPQKIASNSSRKLSATANRRARERDGRS